MPEDAVAHVFGEHSAQTFGRHSVPYISPERVQDSTWVRVLIAKDAISTGWDCPRAEVMVSFRPARDKTHITQLLGRMVRTPLARRIPGNDRLNSVDCLLPFFDEASVKDVANPSRASQDSLGIIYDDGGEPKIVRPDFVFFGQQGDGTFTADIVDPHSIQFGDAIPKLKGLAQYAERFGDQYRRIDAVAKIGDTFRVLDLKEAATRAAVLATTSIKALYEGVHASDYLV